MALLERWRARDELPLHFFYQDNAGQAKARHQAILKTTAPRIVVIDDDMEVCPDFLVQHLKAASSDPEHAIVIGKVFSAPGWMKKPLFTAVGEAGMLRLHARLEAGEKPNASAFVTQNVSFPRALYLAAGGFDFALRLDEDRELGLRLERRGAHYVYAKMAWAIHHSDVGSFEKWQRRQYDYGSYACQVWEKYGFDPFVHPLRDYLNGNALNRFAVSLCVPSDRRVELACWLLRYGGTVLQKLRLYAPALATHKALRSLRYHQGVRDHLGSWEALVREATRYGAQESRPLEPTGSGSTLSQRDL